MPTHPTGVWLTDDGEVVYEQPEGGATQLVAKAGEVSKAVRSRLEALDLTDVDLPPEVDAEAPEEPADKPEAVDTEDAAPVKKAAKRTRKAAAKSSK